MQFTIIPLLAAALTSQIPPQRYATPVLMSDWDSTWIEPGTHFELVGGGVINREGEVAFGAILAGPTINPFNEHAFLHFDGAQVDLAVRQGEETGFTYFPGAYEALWSPVFGGQAIYFNSRINPSVVTSFHPEAMVRSYAGSNAAIITQLEPLTGTEDYVSSFSLPTVSAGDGVIYDVYLTHSIGQPIENSLWMEKGGVNSMLLRRGDQMPNSPAGTRFVGVFGRAMNPQGEIAFVAYLEGPAVNANNQSAVYSDRSGDLRIVARAGQVAVNGARLSQLDYVRMNDRGAIVFQSNLVGGDANAANDRATFFDDGERRIVVREGDAMPGYEEDYRFLDFGIPGINAHNEVVFYGRFNGENPEQEGVFTWTKEAGLSKRITVLDPVPDLPADFHFTSLGSPVLNALGQITFFGEACSPDVCTYGVWAEDSRDRFRAIALTGQELRVGPSDWRTIASASIATNTFPNLADGNESGERMVFNDSGLLTFSAYFTDGTSGTFLIDTLAVPEPATGAIAMTSVVAWLAISRAFRRVPR